jgi:spermidine/putrescine-binding protein
VLGGNRIAIAVLCVSTSFMISCGGIDPGARVTQPSDKKDDEKVINLYIWSDYLTTDTLSSFEKLTSTKVRVSYFETNETLEARVLTGSSGFDAADRSHGTL